MSVHTKPSLLSPNEALVYSLIIQSRDRLKLAGANSNLYFNYATP
ncbi:hypothetical protein OGM63_15945 [Plectonema radiosum NIES-515]|uniref:Uncharacterized protein n=1 Tax=Plectonema radiosum NIES-515 TaxID=2986073 RepID=A0ABT3B0S6_9CYAN|nr:hypothetical protein [Plectonema radiosum]MCV3214988.1 hypothetical protein [Plectonema radiosum NIES-515]